jgi:hypothetical protein
VVGRLRLVSAAAYVLRSRTLLDGMYARYTRLQAQLPVHHNAASFNMHAVLDGHILEGQYSFAAIVHWHIQCYKIMLLCIGTAAICWHCQLLRYPYIICLIQLLS